MNNDKILESMKQNLIVSATMRKAFIEGVTMILGNDGCIDLSLNNQKCYFTIVPYETEEHEKIHGNARNNIAKQFIERYTLEELKAEHLQFVELEEQKATNH